MYKLKNSFCNKEFEDFTEYRYDITNYMKEMMGESVVSSYAKLGFVFKTDDENEQERDEKRIYSLAEDLEKMFEAERQFTIDSQISIYVYFDGGKFIKFSTMDFATLSSED
jgi:hypothetical protein